MKDFDGYHDIEIRYNDVPLVAYYDEDENGIILCGLVVTLSGTCEIDLLETGKVSEKDFEDIQEHVSDCLRERSEDILLASHGI